MSITYSNKCSASPLSRRGADGGADGGADESSGRYSISVCDGAGLVTPIAMSYPAAARSQSVSPLARRIGAAKHAQGFGIVELMIALSLGLVVILGVTTLFTDTSRALSDINRSGRQLESTLFALDLLATELGLVGYWGEARYPVDAKDPATGPFRTGEDMDLADVSSMTMSVQPPACIGSGATVSGTPDDEKAELGWAMSWPVYSATGADLEAELTADTCETATSTPRAGSEFVAIRRASTCAMGSTGCPDYDGSFYLQTNGCYDENANLTGGEIKLYSVTAADVDSTMDYMGQACDSSVAAPIYRYQSRIYYVDQNDVLVRLSLEQSSADMVYVRENLVDGVELLRFEWLVDSSGDGRYDSISRAPAAGEWPNVVGVKIWIVTRANLEEPGYTDTRVYTVAGESWTVPSGNEGYRRLLQSRTVELVNVGARRR